MKPSVPRDKSVIHGDFELTFGDLTIATPHAGIEMARHSYVNTGICINCYGRGVSHENEICLVCLPYVLFDYGVYLLV